MSASAITRKKTLGPVDLAFFSFCAIFVLDTISASAMIGPAAIGWWIVSAILYFLPYGLVSAELGTAYPQQGGLYVWAKKAFGDRFAARTTWYYWVNVALWMPSVYILFAGMFSALFFPAMPLWAQILMAIALTWLTVLVNVKSLSIVKWIPNLGTAAKIVVILSIVAASAKVLLSGEGFANPVDLKSLLPSFDAGLAFLPVIVYNFSGFELISGAAGEMKNPKRDIPVSVLASGLFITLFYILTSGSLLAVIPLEDLSLVSGITDTLTAVFAKSGAGTVIVNAIGILALFTFFANMVTWTLGSNRVMSEAAKAGEMPKAFASETGPSAAPLGASVLTGAVSTVVIIAYAFFAGDAEDLFWSLFAFSSIIFLIPYVLLFPVFLKLRFKDSATERLYKVPGPKPFLVAMCVVAELFLVQAILFFFWVPGEPVDWSLCAPLLVGTALALGIGEFLVWRSFRSRPAGANAVGAPAPGAALSE